MITILEYVIAIAETGSFTKAAEKLFISQSAISQAMQKFERDIGAKIFNREKNIVTLTPAGQIVVKEGKKILLLYQNMKTQVNDIGAWNILSLNVGAASSYQRLYMSQILSEFKSAFPYINLNIITEFSYKMYEGITEGRLDAAIVIGPVPDLFDYINIAREEVFLAVPPNHPLTSIFPKGGEPYPTADLSLCEKENFIPYHQGRHIQGIFEKVFDEVGYLPKTLNPCSSTESVNNMVFHGMGLGIVPYSTIRLCPVEMRSKYYRIFPEGVFRDLVLARLKGEYKSRAQKEFFNVASKIYLEE